MVNLLFLRHMIPIQSLCKGFLALCSATRTVLIMSYTLPYGADYTPERTIFRLWAPQAKEVLLERFRTGSDEESASAFLGALPMQSDRAGNWTLTIAGNLKNQYYQYSITDCAGGHTWSADPWATACGVNGTRSMVVDLPSTNPSHWSEDNYSPPTDRAPVIWETHIRDFSADPRSGVLPWNRGRYRAFTEQDTTLDHLGKAPTCLNYLKQLGITHVQLLPFFDYATVDERAPNRSYNWGYDPMNYNVPEGSYSSDPYHGSVRIRECKEMIQGIHRAGLGVIMDVVYNHTYAPDSWLQRTAPGNYYRYRADGSMADASGCGTETASERALFRSYMVESVCYWAQEYHIDGFRFDLMAIHDVETMNLIRHRLNQLPNGRHILTYGEPWAAFPPCMAQGAIPADKTALTKLNPHMGVFCDDTRNMLAGSPFRATDNSAYGTGKPTAELAQTVRAAVHGWCNKKRHGYALSPAQIVQYVSCHDNFTLWDRLTLQAGNQDFHSLDAHKIQQNKFISGIYLTLDGFAFLQSGEEFARTKSGVGNSFCSPTALNQLDWARSQRFAELVDWYKGLLSLRDELVPLRRLHAANARSVQFLNAPNNCVGFSLPSTNRWKRLLVYYNPHSKPQPVQLPRGSWQTLCDGVDSQLWLHSVQHQRGTIQLPPLTVTILAR